MADVLLATAYLPPVAWFRAAKAADGIVLEQHEHYQKRSARNKALVPLGNGVAFLSIPLQKGKNQQQPIRDVRISYLENWQRLHWLTIQSAYGKSPFFIHYADSLAPLYERKETFLFDWNLLFLPFLLKHTGISTNISFSDSYEPSLPDFTDARHITDFKHQHEKPFQPYAQVFQERLGFTPNASIIDLLFCMGPEAKAWLV